MKRLSLFIFVILVIGQVTVSHPATIRVPQDQPTIQAGIDAAVDGDTVLVDDGLYTGAGNVNLDFKGKAITVKSVNGAAATIIDCQNTASTKGFIFQSGETASSVLNGFTVINGKKNGSRPNDRGGGIYCNSSSPSIINCIITDNETMGNGGGISCESSSSPSIINCLITGNKTKGNGGGIWCDSSSPNITNCTLTGNSATGNGGGIFCGASSSPIIKNTILWADSNVEVFLQKSSSTIIITFSDVQGGRGAFGGNEAAIADSFYQNNIESDPLFGNPFSGLPYDLGPGSPCINVATSAGAPSIDIVGRPRPSGSGVDMGAYEQSDDASLPVELSAFSGAITQDGVILKWRTESETNNLGFHIYRSEEKAGEYVRITSTLISGQENTAVAHNYNFLDKTAPEGATYWYLIEDIDIHGIRERSDPIEVRFDLPRVIPTHFRLWQNYPNPLNLETWIPYELAANAEVTITIYNAQGQQIRTLSLGRQPTGLYLTKDRAAYWNGQSNTGELVSSGIYIYHMQAGDFASTKKMIILK